MTENRVFVLNSDRTPLSPCHPARARQLLSKGKAAVWRMYPFTIILKKQKKNPKFQDTKVKVDPGSKTTGLALILKGEICGWVLVWAANLEHRGQTIKHSLEKRRAVRRSRKNRKTGYRKPRFNNRSRPKGWIPPSLISRVDNIKTWVKRLQKSCYLKSCVVETVRFDTQKMQNPEIRGVQYQQGELQGYEVREYLLEKYDRTCVYCQKSCVPLEIEHVVPKSKGGSNRVSNLVLACNSCNIKKGNTKLEEFLKRKPKLLKSIKRSLKQSLKDTATVNATRNKVKKELKKIIKTYVSTGSVTKYNRTKNKYSKDHWIDAACTGKVSGRYISIPKNFKPLKIKAVGRGNRQMTLPDKYGFPRTTAKNQKEVHGFQTGDIVKAIVTKGKKIGTYFGKVAVRSSGYFNIQTKDKVVQGIGYKYCILKQKNDGYSYII